MERWTRLHRYNRLVDEGLAATLACPDCEREFAFLIGEDDEPVAWCPWEDKKFYPGAIFWDHVGRVVLENWDDAR